MALVLDPLWWSVCGPHANCGETCFQPTLGPLSPTHILPFGVGQRVFGRLDSISGMCRSRGRPRSAIGKISFTPPDIPSGDEDTDCPTNAARRETLTEWRAGPIRHLPAHSRSEHRLRSRRSISASAISGLVRATRCSTGTPARFIRAGSLVQLSGTKRRNAIITGTSRRASVSDTNVWQLARLAERRGVLRSDTNRTIALLRQRGVVDDQHRILAADESVGLNEQFYSNRAASQDAISDEMVQLVIVARRQPRPPSVARSCDRRTDQPRNIKRTHPPSRLVTQTIQEWLKPPRKLIFPPRAVSTMVGPPKADHP